ncbi:P-loop containing nucleoside triphosphate hydrolase protein [Clohesyomyces aquaticus]|uniref:p-loop containing nucleoside triphosphate hydrolase protein n=1 Tax=Clohesyomyces aquaticus TaxID=1231657 RepID=A0A1Y2A8T0_9PLEO|nr:P-loop containing nucleoside triphosphate hydrolase protein [Clohesyomyces aquaticus]
MTSNYSRLIDSTHGERKLPMRVLVLGMCRTGTTSIATALRKLGYTTHTMRSVLSQPSQITLWQEAVNLTLLQPRPKSSFYPPYTRTEFDKLLGDFDAVTDIPSAVFAEQLIEAYPEAKVILTVRNYDDWEHSMNESIWCLFTWRLFGLARICGVTQMAPMMRMLHSVFQAHNGNVYGGPKAKEAYEAHNAKIMKLVPKENLLVLEEPVTDWTWEALCEFLGKQAPKDVFPKMDEDRALRRSLETVWWGMVRYLFLLLTLPGSVILGAVIFFMGGKHLV